LKIQEWAGATCAVLCSKSRRILGRIA
jgi:hypothetical protein